VAASAWRHRFFSQERAVRGVDSLANGRAPLFYPGTPGAAGARQRLVVPYGFCLRRHDFPFRFPRRTPMTARNILSSLLLAVAAGYSASAHAQVLDHLECFKVKDPGNFSALVDLQSTEYGTETGCKVKVKAKFYCVPSTKTVTDTTAPTEDIDGPPHFGPQVCYTIQSCPNDGPVGHEVTDQFGHRTLQNVKRKLVCAPAIAGAPPTTSTTTTTTTLLTCQTSSAEACLNSTSGACATCCSANADCSIACSDAVGAGCLFDLFNSPCAALANSAGCAQECCP
jgi:hypothetical protein